MKSLFILSHPKYADSFGNKKITESVQKHNPTLKVHHLDSIVSNLIFDIETEQTLLLNSDNIIFQFPLFWYYCPSSLKTWIDQVFTHGFAFGSTGDKLKGKNLLISVTIGGKEETYSSDSYNTRKVEEYLVGFQQIAKLSQMNFHGFVFSYGHGARYFAEGLPESTLKQIDKQIETINNFIK